MTDSNKLFPLLGGILAGWGLARLAPILADVWLPLQTARSAFGAVVPMWLWGCLLIATGVAIFSLGKKFTSISTSASHPEQNKTPKAPQKPHRPLSIANVPLPNSADSQVNGLAHPRTKNARTQNRHPEDVHPESGHQIKFPPASSKPSISPASAVDKQGTDAPPKSETARVGRSTHGWGWQRPSTNRERATGPKIVAIGGGTGMPQLLRGLRGYTDNITAIVTVADDGGSSGRLRFMGVLPPGDFRNNIAALSESEDLITRLFQYRFAQNQWGAATARKLDGPSGSGPHEDKTGLAGHNFGNLFIATMAAVTGSFEAGLVASSRVLAVRGRVLPSTLEHVTLCAEVSQPEGWVLVKGESQIPEAGGAIQRVFLEPQTPHAYPEAIQAILQADLILAGPGSFFTSVLPNLIVPAVQDAIIASSAPSIYLCNIATQPGETDNYTVSDHMRQLQLHARGAFTNVLANDVYDRSTRPGEGSDWVTLPTEDRRPGHIATTVQGTAINYQLFTGDLVDETLLYKHDAQKLAAETMNVYQKLVAASR